jgi:hypothetical protein
MAYNAGGAASRAGRWLDSENLITISTDTGHVCSSHVLQFGSSTAFANKR